MKILFFVLFGISFCLTSGLAKTVDPYSDLPWLSPQITAKSIRATAGGRPSLIDFKKTLSNGITFAKLLSRIGIPNAEYDPTIDKTTRIIPAYHGGHLFRYDLSNADKVYIWTTEDNDSVALAVHQPKSGTSEVLYKKSL